MIALAIFVSVNNTIVYNEIITKIKEAEGYSAVIYNDNGHQAIGYGCRYFKNLTSVTESQADSLLKEQFNNNLNFVKYHYKDLNTIEQMVLAKIAFNWGIGNLLKSKLVKNNQLDTNILFHYRKIDKQQAYLNQRNFELKTINKRYLAINIKVLTKNKIKSNYGI